MEITVTIKYSTTNARLTVPRDASILNVKERISELPELCSSSSDSDVMTGIPVSQQRLIYKGRGLKDDHTLEHYGESVVHRVYSSDSHPTDVQDGHAIHLVKGAAAPPAPAPSVSEERRSSSTPTGRADLSSMVNQLGGLGDMNRMQEQLMRNPELMQQIMSSPMMESLLNNPETMRSMLLNNPSMQAMYGLDTSSIS